MGSKVPVAVVTSAHTGVGLTVVHCLCRQYHGKGVVYLTSRNVERGKKAMARLEKDGLKPRYHQLDVTKKESVETFRDYLEEKYGYIDVLVNSAAMKYLNNTSEPPEVQAEQALFVNYSCLVFTCDILFPLLRKGSRVVNLASFCGHLSLIPSDNLRKKLSNPNMTIPELSALMQQYVDAVKQGNHTAEWGDSSYFVVSKIGATALSILQQRQHSDKEIYHVEGTYPHLQTVAVSKSSPQK